MAVQINKLKKILLQFCIVSMYSDNPIVPEVLVVVLGQPTTGHLAVRHTSMRLIGEMRDWINQHPEVIGMRGLLCYTSVF